MKKLETLKKLLQVVKTAPLASGSYCREGKTCVIGHVMLIGGLTFDELKEIQNGNLYADWYSIDSIVQFANNNELKKDLVSPALIACGFDIKSEADVELLTKLQVANDRGEKEAVLPLLEEEIKKMEENKNE